MHQFEQLQQAQPQNAEAYLGLAEARAVAGQLDEARAAFMVADMTAQRHGPALLAQTIRRQRGQFELSFGDRVEGRALLVALAQAEPTNPLLTLQLVNLLAGYGEYRAARQLAERLPTLIGEAELNRLMRLGFLRDRDGDSRGAMTAFRAALKLLPTGNDRRFYVADQLIRLARRDGRLVQLCEEWKPLAKDDKILRAALVRAHTELQQFPQALALVSGEAAADAPDQQAEILIRAGLAGQEKWALEQVEAREKRDPSVLLWMVSRVRLLSDLGRKAELERTAKSLMERSVGQDARQTTSNSTPRRWVELGEAFRYAGLTAATHQCAGRVVETLARSSGQRLLDPADFKSLDWVAGLRASSGQRESISTLLKRFEPRTGVDPNSRLQLAEIYARHALWREFDALWSGIKDLPLRDDILLRVAYMLETGGRHEQGLRLWEKISRDAKDRLTRDQAAARVADLNRATGDYDAYLSKLEARVASGQATATERQLLTRAYLAEINTRQGSRATGRQTAMERLTEFYRQQTSRHPRDVGLANEAATFFAELGDLPPVERLTAQLIRVNPAEAATYRRRLVHALAERGTEAAFERALAEFAPGKLDACGTHLFRARALLLAASSRPAAAGEKSEPHHFTHRAIAESRQALAAARQSQDRSAALLSWSQALIAASRPSEAVALLRYRMSVDNDPRVVQRLAEEFLTRPTPFSLRWTAMTLSRLLAEEPYLPQVHYQLAVVRAELGDKQYAALRDAVDLSIDQRAVWLRELVDRTKADNNSERTLGLLRELLACENDLPPAVAMEYGRFALQRGDEALADRAFDGILRYGGQASVLEQLGDLYLNAGRYDRASTVFERGARLAPQSPSLLYKSTLLAEIRGAAPDRVFAGYARALRAAINAQPLTQGAASNIASPQMTGGNREELNLNARIQQSLLGSSTGEQRGKLIAEVRESLATDLASLKSAERLSEAMAGHPRVVAALGFMNALGSGLGDSTELNRMHKLAEAHFPDDPTLFERRLAERQRASDVAGANAMLEERLSTKKPINTTTLVSHLLRNGRGEEARQHWLRLVRTVVDQGRGQPGGQHSAVQQVTSFTQMLASGLPSGERWDFAVRTLDALPTELHGRFIFEMAMNLTARERALPQVMKWLRSQSDQIDTNFQWQFRNYVQMLPLDSRQQLREELRVVTSQPDAPWHARFCALLLSVETGEQVNDTVVMAEAAFRKFVGQPSHVLMQFMREVWQVTAPNDRPQLLEAYFQHLSRQTNSPEGLLPAFQLAFWYGLDVADPSALAVLTRRIPQLDGDAFRKVLEMSLPSFTQDARAGALAPRLAEYALQRDSSDPVALVIAAVVAFRKDDKEAGLKHAVAAFGQIGSITREREQLWRAALPALISALTHRNLVPEVRARIEKLASDSRNNPEFQLALVQLLQIEGRRGDQLTILRRAFESNADSTVLFKAYAQLLCEAGQFFAAREAAERYLERRPSATKVIGDYAYPDHDVQQLLTRIYSTLGDRRGEYRAAKFMANHANGTFGGVQPPAPQQALAAGEIEEARGLAIQHHFNDPIRVALAIPAFNRPEDTGLFLSAVGSLPPSVTLNFAHYTSFAEMYDRLGALPKVVTSIEKRLPVHADRTQSFLLRALLAALFSLDGNAAAAARVLDEALAAEPDRPNSAAWNADLCELHVRAGNVARAWQLADAMPDTGVQRLASLEEGAIRLGPATFRSGGNFVVSGGTTITFSGTNTVTRGRGGSSGVLPPPPPPFATPQIVATTNRYKWRLLEAALGSSNPDNALALYLEHAKPERDFALGIKLAWWLAVMGRSAAAEQLIARLTGFAELDGSRRLALEGVRSVIEVVAGRATESVLLVQAVRMGVQFAEYAVPVPGEAPVGAAWLKVVVELAPRLSLQPQQRSEMDRHLLHALARAGLREAAREVAERSPLFGRSSAENDAQRAVLLQAAGQSDAALSLFSRLHEERTLPISAILPFVVALTERAETRRAIDLLAFASENTDDLAVLRTFAANCLDRGDHTTATRLVARMKWTAPRDAETRELERRVRRS